MEVDGYGYLETGEFTMKSDIWSFGIVLWEILSIGREPYPAADTKSTVDEIKGYFEKCAIKHVISAKNYHCNLLIC